jgi:hypothetical protein
MTTINTGFTNHSDHGLHTDASHIRHNMTDNDNFPDPVPTIDKLGKDLDEYSAALDNMGKGMNATLVKNEKRKNLEETLTLLGHYVETVANGNEIIAESSGFKLKAKPSPVGILPKPVNFKVVPAPVKGSVKVSVNRIHGAKTYRFEYKLSANVTDNRWMDVVHPQSSAVISDLISGQEYLFRAVAIGSNPTRVYSDVISSFVL